MTMTTDDDDEEGGAKVLPFLLHGFSTTLHSLLLRWYYATFHLHRTECPSGAIFHLFPPKLDAEGKCALQTPNHTFCLSLPLAGWQKKTESQQPVHHGLVTDCELDPVFSFHMFHSKNFTKQQKHTEITPTEPNGDRFTRAEPTAIRIRH